MLGDDGLVADVIQHEAAGAVGVLGHTRGEGTVADEGGGLVAQAAGDGDAVERARADVAVALTVGGGKDGGQADLLAVDAEEIEQAIIVVEGLEVHEHSTGGVGDVGDQTAAGGATVQVVDEPSVNGTEGQAAGLVGLADLGQVPEHPDEGDGRGVGGEGETADTGQLVGTGLSLEVADEAVGPSIGPGDGIVEGLPGLPVKADGGLPLRGDADGLDGVGGVAEGEETFHGLFNANVDGVHQFEGILFVVSTGISIFPSFKKILVLQPRLTPIANGSDGIHFDIWRREHRCSQR